MAITAKIIEHSVSPAGKELITFELEYPRFIHSEFMTHRVFSRNAASSRAIPVKRMLEQVKHDPVVPHHWGANQPGMQARSEISPERREKAEHEWRRAAQHAAYFAESLHDLGLHKQIVNRLVEPFMWMRTIATVTETDNFFELRRHEDAEPHFQLLAERMWEVARDSTPRPRECAAQDVFQWHLPYVLEAERHGAALELGARAGFFLAQISAARCARVSYLTHDGREPELQEDVALFERLAGSSPIHASPLEHQAFPAEHASVRSGNFFGWHQFRKFVEAGIAAGHLKEETANA
jgi:thymidylate synthase ThyX